MSDALRGAATAVEASRERERILAEYRRREAEINPTVYAPWDAAAQLELSGRRRLAARLLKDAGVPPRPGDECLEIGCGLSGWLPDFLAWGVPETCLHGIDLIESRIQSARRLLPAADLRVGDATALPWPDRQFRFVVASTVLTSILSVEVRRAVAVEIVRVLEPGGGLLWYDFAYNNPRNPNVRKVDRQELAALFPQLRGTVRTSTLAPPIARSVARWSWAAATCLEALPFLRTHLLGVLVKDR